MEMQFFPSKNGETIAAVAVDDWLVTGFRVKHGEEGWCLSAIALGAQGSDDRRFPTILKNGTVDIAPFEETKFSKTKDEAVMEALRHTKPATRRAEAPTRVSPNNAFNALNDGLSMLNAILDHAAISEGLGRCLWGPIWVM